MLVPTESIERLPDTPTVRDVAQALMAVARTTWQSPKVVMETVDYVAFHDLDAANPLFVEVRTSTTKAGTKALYVDLSCVHAVLGVFSTVQDEEGVGTYPVTCVVAGTPEMTREKRNVVLTILAKFIVTKTHPFCSMCSGAGVEEGA